MHLVESVANVCIRSATSRVIATAREVMIAAGLAVGNFIYVYTHIAIVASCATRVLLAVHTLQTAPVCAILAHNYLRYFAYAHCT